MQMSQALPPGTILGNRYRIRRVLSESSNKALYHVEDTKVTDKSWVAHEYLLGSGSKEESVAVQSFLHQSFESLKLLSHPGLAQVIDWFQEGDRIYLVVEYVDGLSINALTQIAADSFSQEQVLKWAVQICELLEYLHSLPQPFFLKGLDPHCILVDRDGHIKVEGFGLEMSLNQKGSAAGDIYSLGVCLYLLLTRKTPEQSAESVKQLNPQISDELSDLIQSCMDEEASRRPADATVLKGRLMRILSPLPPSPVPQKSRLYLNEIYESVAIWVNRIVTVAVDLGAIFYNKPYFIFLILFVIAVSILTFRPFGGHAGFEKKSPLVYVLYPKKVVAVDLNQLRIVGSIPLPNLHFLAFAPKASDVWCASARGQIFGVNVQHNIVDIRLDLKEPIGGMALSSNGNLYLSLLNDNILSVVGPSGLPLAEVPVGTDPGDVALDYLHHKVFVANKGTHSITVIDTVKYTVMGTMSLAFVPDHIVLNPDGKYLFAVSDDSERLDVFSAESDASLNSVGIAIAGPYSLSATNDAVVVTAHAGNQVLFYQIPSLASKTIVSLNKPESIGFSADGLRAYVSDASGYLSTLDASSGRILGSFYTGKSPLSLVFVP